MVRATATETEWVDPVTDDHLRAIGRVMVEWSRTERVIMDSLWELATGQSFDTLGAAASISLAPVTGMEPRVSLGILKAVFHARLRSRRRSHAGGTSVSGRFDFIGPGTQKTTQSAKTG